MSRFRLYPTPAQEAKLLEHCAHARFVWNLGLEQQSWWRPGRSPMPGRFEQQRQLTEARAAEPWLAAGSTIIQQCALNDLDLAWRKFFAGTHGRPRWRKAGKSDGFRVTGSQAQRIVRVSHRWSAALIPKLGMVRFRRTRVVPVAKSYRITRDQVGRWHIAFSVWPAPIIPAPGTGEIVGIDLGVTVSAALSTGELLNAPRLSPARRRRLRLLQRRLSRAKRGSRRREVTRLAIARLKARERDARKDWCEKVSTDLARRFDIIRVEDLSIVNLTRSAKGTVRQPGRNVRQKAGLNRGIMASGWGVLVRRLEQKAPSGVAKINPRHTSMTCNACGYCAAENRKSQAVFACVACGHRDHADINAAKNIAAGHAATAREGSGLPEPVNREPSVA